MSEQYRLSVPVPVHVYYYAASFNHPLIACTFKAFQLSRFTSTWPHLCSLFFFLTRMSCWQGPSLSFTRVTQAVTSPLTGELCPL